MISPISTVPFKGVSDVLSTDKTMSAIENTQKAMVAVTNLKEGSDEFKKNIKQDSEAYSDAIKTITDKAEENAFLKPVAKVANSKAGKKLADIFGGFTAFCTNLAGAATSVSSMTK